MNSTDGLFRLAAIASVLSAITTAVLMFGPDAPAASDITEQAKQHASLLATYKLWVLFFHPQFAFLASIGVTIALYPRSPALVAFGLFYLLVWSVTEMTQQAYALDALNAYWRPGLIGAESEEDRQTYITLIKGMSGISDSMYFVLLFGFGVGTLLFGFAFLSRSFFEIALGVTLIFIGVLSLTAFTGYYAGFSAATPVTGWIYEHIYGIVQPGVRLALGVWLWRRASAFRGASR